MSVPHPSNRGEADLVPNEEMEMGGKGMGNDTCRHWIRGTCRLGVSCNFRHPDSSVLPMSEPKRKPKKWCRFAFRGKCPFGPNGGACVYTHVEEWCAQTPKDREAMAMPSMLSACTSNMRRELHSAIVEAWAAGSLDYAEAFQYMVDCGFDCVDSRAPHLAVHQVAENIVTLAHDDLSLLAKTEPAIHTLQWILDRAHHCFVPSQVGGAASGGGGGGAPNQASPPRQSWNLAEKDDWAVCFSIPFLVFKPGMSENT